MDTSLPHRGQPVLPSARARAWSVRFYRDGDEEQVNDLFNRVFGRTRTLAQWKWKFSDNPLASEKVFVIGTISGTIVGMYPCVMSSWRVADERVMAVEPVETAIEESARDGRLIGAMFKAHVERSEAINVRFSYGTPNDGHYKFGKRRLGYRDMAELAILYKRINMKLPGIGYVRWPSLVRRRFNHELITAGQPVECATRGGLRVEIMQNLDGRFDRLWDLASPSHQVIAVRNTSFLKWRYFDNPLGQAVCLGAVEGGTLMGYLMLFLRNERRGYAGVVADLFALPGFRIEETLIKAASRYCREARVDYMRAGALPHCPLYDSFREAGFAGTSRTKKVVYMPFAGANSAVLQDPAHWYLTLGDFDFDEG